MTDKNEAAKHRAKIQEISERHLKAFGTSRKDIKLPFEEQTPNSGPILDLINQRIAEVDNGEEIAQTIVNDCIAYAEVYEMQRRYHPYEPKHPVFTALMEETYRLYTLWQTTSSLPLINLKLRVDRARGFGLSAGYRPVQERPWEYDPHEHTMSGGASGLSATQKRSDATANETLAETSRDVSTTGNLTMNSNRTQFGASSMSGN